MVRITRSLFTFGIMLFVALGVSAQKKVNSISVELLGAQNTVGINYDSRFNGNSGLGYRIGVGFGYGYTSVLFDFDEDIKGVGVPVELNYLLGKRHHKLEVGFGASLGVYHVKTTWFYYQPDSPEAEWNECTSTSNRFGYFMFGDIGYRYQREKGFMFRAGVSPSFNFGDKCGLNKSAFYPYVGFGWSF